jgi:hypothetical protein
MDKNKFWLGGRLFNTASPRLGAPTQRKARPQDGRPNATQGTSAGWAPQRKARHVRKLGASNAHPQRKATSASAAHRNTRHVCNARQGTSATQGTSASWAPQRMSATQTQGTSAMLGAPTQRKARPQDGHPNAKLIRNENVHTREH